jgi:choline kinase
MSVRAAIVLAAGVGSRLRGVIDDRPKGLIEIGGEALMARSVRLLADRGVTDVVLVAGHRADAYHAFAADRAGVRVVVNAGYASTGSMASLAVAIDSREPSDVLVLESDIVYEARALDRLLSSPDGDATLVSGLTDAGDEVWVSAPGGWLRAMSKARGDLPSVDGEFVGITRLSAGGVIAMRDAFRRFADRHGHGRMDYETGALVEVAAARRIAALGIPDLCWGEIDDERQYDRVTRLVWPRVQ